MSLPHNLVTEGPIFWCFVILLIFTFLQFFHLECFSFGQYHGTNSDVSNSQMVHNLVISWKLVGIICMQWPTFPNSYHAQVQFITHSNTCSEYNIKQDNPIAHEWIDPIASWHAAVQKNLEYFCCLCCGITL